MYEALGPVFAPFYTVPLPKGKGAEPQQNNKNNRRGKNNQNKPTETSKTQNAVSVEETTTGVTAPTETDTTPTTDTPLTDAPAVVTTPTATADSSIIEVGTDAQAREEEEGEIVSAEPTEPTPAKKAGESEEQKKLRAEHELYQKLLQERQQVFSEIQKGDIIYVLEGHYRVVDPKLIYKPGCDASSFNDKEVSDDVCYL